MKESINTRKHISQKMIEHARDLLLKEFENVEVEFHHKDVFGFTANGASCEIEIKVNDYDFNKEFTKPSKKFKHDNYKTSPEICPTRFYFMVPRNLLSTARNRIERTSWYQNYGLIIYDDFMDAYKIIKKSEILSTEPFTGEILTIPFKDYKHKRIIL